VDCRCSKTEILLVVKYQKRVALLLFFFALKMKKFVAHYIQSFSGIESRVWLLSLAMFINRSGSMVLLFTGLYLTHDLHYSMFKAGWVLSIYGIGSIMGSFVGGWLTDKKNNFYLMVFSLIGSGLILLMLPLTTNYYLINIIVFCYAVVADAFRPANSAAIAHHSTDLNRTRSVSLMRLAINLGFTVGPAIGGLLAFYVGYKWLFVMDAFTSFAAAGLLIVYLPNIPKFNYDNDNKIKPIKAQHAYTDLHYVCFIALVALYGMCFFQLFASVPLYLKKVYYFNEAIIGGLLALNGLLVVLIEMPLVAFLEYKTNLFNYIILGVLFIPLSFLTLIIGKGFLLAAIVYTFFMTLSEVMAMPFMMNFVLNRPTKEKQGQYSALYSIAYGIANILAPLAGLAIAEQFGFNNMFFLLITISIFIALGFLWLKKHV
jgi:predicted MFS family arabinose efflux permease